MVRVGKVSSTTHSCPATQGLLYLHGFWHLASIHACCEGQSESILHSGSSGIFTGKTSKLFSRSCLKVILVVNDVSRQNSHLWSMWHSHPPGRVDCKCKSLDGSQLSMLQIDGMDHHWHKVAGIPCDHCWHSNSHTSLWGNSHHGSGIPLLCMQFGGCLEAQAGSNRSPDGILACTQPCFRKWLGCRDSSIRCWNTPYSRGSHHSLDTHLKGRISLSVGIKVVKKGHALLLHWKHSWWGFPAHPGGHLQTARCPIASQMASLPQGSPKVHGFLHWFSMQANLSLGQSGSCSHSPLGTANSTHKFVKKSL